MTRWTEFGCERRGKLVKLPCKDEHTITAPLRLGRHSQMHAQKSSRFLVDFFHKISFITKFWFHSNSGENRYSEWKFAAIDIDIHGGFIAIDIAWKAREILTPLTLLHAVSYRSLSFFRFCMEAFPLFPFSSSTFLSIKCVNVLTVRHIPYAQT